MHDINLYNIIFQQFNFENSLFIIFNRYIISHIYDPIDITSYNIISNENKNISLR